MFRVCIEHSKSNFSRPDPRSGGLILRAHLVKILKERLFTGDDAQQLEKAWKYSPSAWRMECDVDNVDTVAEGLHECRPA